MSSPPNDQGDSAKRAKKSDVNDGSPNASSSSIPVPSSSSSSAAASAELPPWVAGASPVKTYNIEAHLSQLCVDVDKLFLAHEIAVDPSFSMAKLAAARGPLHAQVSRAMKDAFWDILRTDLAATPPVYDHAIGLVNDARSMMLSMVLDNQVQLRTVVAEALDTDHIRHAVQRGVFDLHYLLQFILTILGQMCAPIRDGMIAELKNENDVVTAFRGIFELMELMKTDLADFTVNVNLQSIRSGAADYEREVFCKILRSDPSADAALRAFLQGVLSRHFPDLSAPLTKNQARQVIGTFYLDLLEGGHAVQAFPETFKLDQERVAALSEKIFQLEILLPAIFVATNLAGRQVCEATDIKQQLRHDLIPITNDVEPGSHLPCLEAVAVQCNAVVGRLLGDSWTPDRASIMTNQILDLTDVNNPVRKLSADRIRAFVLSILTTEGNNEVSVPPGLSTIVSELMAVISAYMKLVSHNWRAFGSFYEEVVGELLLAAS